MGDTIEASRDRPVGPVHRAFALLQIVVSVGEPVGVRELSRRSGLTKSTTARLLGILTDLGMVERTSGGAARPGAGLATLTLRLDQSPALLRDRLRPLTVEMEREFGENAAVGIDDGDGFLYLASARSDAAVQVADPSGERFPFHLVAPGLVAMSTWEDGRLDAYLADPLPAATPNSVVEPTVVRQRLSDVRRDGFVWTDQELDVDVNGLAVPVAGGGGGLIAVATLYGPAYRLAPGERPGLGDTLASFVAERADALLGLQS